MPLFNNTANEERFVNAIEQLSYAIPEHGGAIAAALRDLGSAPFLSGFVQREIHNEQMEWARYVREQDAPQALVINPATGETVTTQPSVEIELREETLTAISHALVQWEVDAVGNLSLNAPFQAGATICCGGRGCLEAFQRIYIITLNDWAIPPGWATRTRWFEGPLLNSVATNTPEEVRHNVHHAHRVEVYCGGVDCVMPE